MRRTLFTSLISSICKVLIVLFAILFLCPFANAEGVRKSTRGEFHEYDIKIAYLFELAKFVEWPITDENRDYFSYCVVGDNPFGDRIEVLASRKLHKKKIQISYLADGDSFEECDVVFTSSRDPKIVNDISSRSIQAGVLCISDYLEGCMIRFIELQDHIKLEVDLEQTLQAGFHVSSQLLLVSKIKRAK